MKIGERVYGVIVSLGGWYILYSNLLLFVSDCAIPMFIWLLVPFSRGRFGWSAKSVQVIKYKCQLSTVIVNARVSHVSMVSDDLVTVIVVVTEDEPVFNMFEV